MAFVEDQDAINIPLSGYQFSDAEAADILFTETAEEITPSAANIDLYHDLLRLREREVDLKLHGIYLSDFFKKQHIPRGFRIRNTPTIGRSNVEFCKRWCQILNKCSMDLMLLVIEEVSKNLISTRSELAAFEGAHLSSLMNDKDSKLMEKLQTQLSRYTVELHKFKKQKVITVNADYQNRRVYRWLTGGEVNATNRMRRQQTTGQVFRIDSSPYTTNSSDAETPDYIRRKGGYRGIGGRYNPSPVVSSRLMMDTSGTSGISNTPVFLDRNPHIADKDARIREGAGLNTRSTNRGPKPPRK